MPMYKVEQYEIWTQTYLIEAASEAEAIKKLFDGEADAMDNGLEYIEIADDFGMAVEEAPDLADELRALGVDVGECIISSIRFIEEAE